MIAVGAHFHYEHNARKQQCLRILDHLHITTRPLAQGHRIMLADHNSLIVPSRDAEVPAKEKKLEILAARDIEVSSLQRGEVHNLHSCYNQNVPPRYTYGYSI